MNEDNIPTGRAVILEPNNSFGKVILYINKKGWIGRMCLKLASIAAGYVAGFMDNHGGQHYSGEIAAGVAASLIFGGEAIWSWVVFKNTHEKISNALNEGEIPNTIIDNKIISTSRDNYIPRL